MGLFWEGTLPGGRLSPFHIDVGHKYMITHVLHIVLY